MDSHEMEALFVRTLMGDYESDDAWEAVARLRSDGSQETFDHAVEWCSSDTPLKRARAAMILSQLRRAPLTNIEREEPHWLFRDKSFALIIQVLEGEDDVEVLDSCISALGHLDQPEAIPFILRYLEHKNENVRFAVAFALGCYPNDEQSVAGLLQLTSDVDPDVRDWAVFGLAVQGDADSADIREALLRCLQDGDEDVREEAAVGLGRRHEQRLIPTLLTMIDSPELKVRVAEAASALLGLDVDPPEWEAEDYKAALKELFPLSNKVDDTN